MPGNRRRLITQEVLAMRLSELAPEWIVGGTYVAYDERDLPTEWPCGTGPRALWRYGMGVRFRCPMEGHDHRVVLWFSNPLDGDEPISTAFTGGDSRRWRREGSTFNDLSLSPMVHITGVHHCNGQPLLHTPWSGTVIRGEVCRNG
jgi:hypothetical protein